MSTETVDGWVDLPGVPKSISRANYLELIKSLGFEIKDLMRLEFEGEAIYATVRALNERGHVYLVGDEVATHRICIPVSDSGIGVRFRPTGGGYLQEPPSRPDSA